MTIEVVVFDIHVDSAVHTILSCHARFPGLDAEAQTAIVQGVHDTSTIVSFGHTNYIGCSEHHHNKNDVDMVPAGNGALVGGSFPEGHRLNSAYMA